MATIEFLGGDDTGNVGKLKWGKFVFEINKAVPCDDPHIVKKAMGNRFFRVDGDTSQAKVHPLAKARAAKAAKRAAAAEDNTGDAA